IRAGYFPEAHSQTLFKECSHYCELISGANQIALARGRDPRGGRRARVSVAVIPGDVALQPSDAPPAKVAGFVPPAPVIVPARGDLDRLSALLNGATRITLLCGSGCEGAASWSK